MKRCSKCGEEKEIKYFYKNKHRKDGLDNWCKECAKQYNKQYRKNNKDKIKKNYKDWVDNNKKHYKKYQKIWRENNKEHIKEYQEKWRENNKDYTKEYMKEYSHSPVPFNSKLKLIEELKLYEEVTKSPDGNVMCKCAYCGGWFEPKYSQIQSRVAAANSISLGECRLYCKDGCKLACPTYGQILHSKDMKPGTAREVQPELRKMVIDRDNHTCQKCNTHNDNLEVSLHCHHIEGIQHEPLQSADTDMCITFCADCHNKVHQIPGCGRHDMQCI